MKSPLWIVNSSLLFLTLVVLIYVLVPKKVSLHKIPLSVTAPLQTTFTEISKVNIDHIYEHDIFGTYDMKPIITPSQASQIPTIPEPPKPIPLYVDAPAIPEFLPPLNFTLKGVILDEEETRSYAILLNNATREEHLYKAGGKVEDAHIIKIMKEKVIVLRNNGQQETIYLSPEMLKKETYFVHNKAWSHIVQKIDDSSFAIDPTTFAHKIRTLANFIGFCDFTTAFKEGKNMGIRVGSTDQSGIVYAVGLEYGDIITSIMDISVNTTKGRVEAYQKVIGLPLDSSVKVSLLRKGALKSIAYKLVTIQETEKNKDKKPLEQKVFDKKALGETFQDKNDSRSHKIARSLGSGAPRSAQSSLNDRELMVTRGGKDQVFKRGQPSQK